MPPGAEPSKSYEKAPDQLLSSSWDSGTADFHRMWTKGGVTALEIVGTPVHRRSRLNSDGALLVVLTEAALAGSLHALLLWLN